LTQQIKFTFMKLEITKEKVLEAASKCSTAKETLKTLFPEVFVEDKSVTIEYQEDINSKDGSFLLCSLEAGENKRKGFYLNDDFKWSLIYNGKNELCLIPTKK